MKDSKQMELIPSTSSLEDTLANLSPSQVEKKVKKIRDTSGQSILDLSKSSGQLGLLEKMLVDTLNSVSTPLSRTWRVKTTPLGRLVFQLRASVPTTKEKESGYWLTPNAMDSLPPRSKEALKKQYQTNRKGRTTHSTLREQVVYPKPNQMWRTPDAHSGRGPSSEERMKMKLDKKMPISLNDQVAHLRGGREKTTGQLNPTWVEWLMGYPSGWTDLNHLETVSSPKSPTTSDPLSSKRWRTPTAIDGGDKAEKYAARILLGKNKRSSKHKVQETLSMQVAMEELKDDPQRVEELMKEEMTTRPQLPEQKEFVEYMHSQTTPRKLSDQSGIDYTTVEHWFRRGKYFSHPSIKDWNHIKQFLQEVKFDKEMTTTETIECKN